MSSLFVGLNTANQAIQADQVEIQTINHNIANANTEGFTQQTPDLTASPPYTVPSILAPAGAGQIGSGVTVSAINRSRDPILDNQYRYQNQFAGQYSTLDTQLTQVQSIFPEPSTNALGGKLSNFWNSWQGLADNPTDAGSRATLQQNALALATQFNNNAQQLTTAQQSADNTVQTSVNTINTDAQQIANLNQQIRAIIASGKQPNDLLDQRDLLLDSIAKMTPITYSNNSDGTITVQLATQVPGSTQLQADNTNVPALVSGTLVNPLVYNAMQSPSYTYMTTTQQNSGIASGNETLTTSLTSGPYSGSSQNILVKVSAVGGGVVTGAQYSTNGGSTWTAAAGAGPFTATIGANTFQFSFTNGANAPQTGDTFALSTDTLATQYAAQQVAGTAGNTGNGTLTAAGTYTGNAGTLYKVQTTTVTNGVVSQYSYETSTNGGSTWSAWTGPVSATTALAGMALTFNPGSTSFAGTDTFTISGASLTPSNTTVANTLTQPATSSTVNALYEPVGGQLGAALQLRDSIIGGTSGMLNQLNQMAQQVFTTVNTQQEAGYDLNNNRGQAFFSITGPSVNGTALTAANFSVASNILTNTNTIAAATSASSPGDGSNAQAVSNLQGLTGQPTNQTVQQAYVAMITTLGAQAQQAQSNDQNQSTVMNTLTNQRQSIGGVSTNEQLTYLVQFQNSFQASAKIISTIDNMLSSVIALAPAN